MKRTTFFLTMAFILCFVVSASAFFHDLNPSFTVKKTGFFSSITKDLKDKGSIPSSKSDSVPSASSSIGTPTVRREAFEYYGLCVKRHIELVEFMGESFDTYAAQMIFGNIVVSGGNEIDTSFGTIVLDLETHEVEEVRELFYKVDAKNETNHMYMYTCLAIMSALEYSNQDEISDKQASYFQKDIKVGIHKFLDLWINGIGDKFMNAMISKPTDEMLVYSGNYDYYIDMFTAPEGEKMFFLIARARK